jgi:hypothetical protein
MERLVKNSIATEFVETWCRRNVFFAPVVFLSPKGPRIFFSKNNPNLPFLAQEAQMN